MRIVQQIPERSQIEPRDQWDLSQLFASDEDWHELFQQTEARLKKYQEWREQLSQSAENLRQGLEFDLAIERDIERLFVYAHLKNDQDKSNQHYLSFFEQILNLHHRAAEESSFIVPQILALDPDLLEKYIQNELEDYRTYLAKITRYRPHTLDSSTEKILAMSGDMADAPELIFSQLDNVDMSFGEITLPDEQKKELSHGNFLTLLQNSNRDFRREVFFQYYRAYDGHKNSLAASLSQSVKKDLFYTKVRDYPSTMEMSLFADNMPASVYDNLVAGVSDNLSPLYRYFELRRRILAIPELHIYDTYVPLISDLPFHMDYEEAVATCIQALEPLGQEYTTILKKGLLEGWVDRYENKGKRSGAYSSGCYDSPPYILLNYDPDNINSLYTLIHEAGHSMHSYYSNQNQPFSLHDYTIFVAEVASTFNEALLSRYLLDKYRDDKRMTAYILNREIDNIRGTFYRQTMFAEFERIIHSKAQKNDPLTLEAMQSEYHKLLQKYFGDTMVIDDTLSLEFLRIPHFYSSFYVYKYATGISAAISLVQKVLSGDRARQDYLHFLTLGGSHYPLEELRLAGVDMESPEAIQATAAYFQNTLNELEKVMQYLE